MKQELFSIFAIFIVLGGIFWFSPVFAQLSLYKVNDSLIYPDIYSIEELISVQNLDEMKQNIEQNLNLLLSKRGYLVKDEGIIADATRLKTTYVLPQKIIFQKMNNTRYLVKISGIQNDFVLALNQRFHNGWKIRKISENKFSECALIKKTSFSFIDECTLQNKIFYLDTIKNFLIPIYQQKDLVHFRMNGFNNAWIFPYTGESEIILSIDFDVQKNALLGHTISFFFFIFCILYLLFDWIRKK